MIDAKDIFGEQPDPFRGAQTAVEFWARYNKEHNSQPDGIAEDEPSGSALPSWPKLHEAALYGLAGDVVKRIEPHTEADPAAILFQFLATAANVIGPGPHCMAESTRHPLIIDPIIVGETSKARKGTSWGHVKRLFASVAPKWASDRVATGLSSAEGLIAEVRDGADPELDRRLLVIQTEFASVLRIMERKGNTLSPVLRNSFDGEVLRTLTKHDPLKATGAHVGLIAHITLNELMRYLNDTEAHNGFANRLLFVCAKRSKFLPEGGALTDRDLQKLADRMRKVVRWVGEREFVIRREDHARELWAGIYPKLSAGRPGLLGAATSRGEAYTLRLSALYALLDCSAVVRAEHLKAALACWDYAFDSAKFIFADAVGDPVADRILEALRNAGADGLTRTQIRDLFARHQPQERITQAFNQLAALGVAFCVPVSTEGRSIEMWIATEATKATEE